MTGQRPDREDLLELARRDPEALVDAFLALWDRVEAIEAKLAELTSNSRNSSKPPSSDRNNPNKPSKPPGRRAKRPRGGQPGHKGRTLDMRANPDFILEHALPLSCRRCGGDLSGVNADEYERRQVFDLPAITMEVTEHRAAAACCPGCGDRNRGAFPKGVCAPVQYGTRVHALATYLSAYQMLPCHRTSELFNDLLGCAVSTGSIVNMLSRAGARAEPLADEIKEKIARGSLIHADETGASMSGKNHWLHVASTKNLSYYAFHPNRGFQAMEDIGLLPDFQGKVVHDFYSSYYRLPLCSHVLCNAHHLRDLTYISEELKQEWAEEMARLLLKAKKLRDRANEGGRKVGPKTEARVLAQYRKILRQGYAANPEPPKRPGKRGRPKRGKALNLLDRFRQREEEVLGFFLNEGTPFDNNQAERDLRMIKAKLKISGCFRSPKAADAFAKVRSLVSTARKAGVRMLDVLEKLFEQPEQLARELLA